MFRFSNHPAAIGISDGIQDAFGYLQASWRRWLPVAAVVATGTFLLYALVDAGTLTSFYYIDPETGHTVFTQDAPQRIGNLLALAGASSMMTLVGSWVFYATAIAGLRNRPLTATGVVIPGLLMIVCGLVLVLLFGAVFVGLIAFVLIVPPVGVLLFLAAIPIVVYVGIRLSLASLAIFDGFGPIAAMHESWRLSQRSVGRLFGWGLVAGAIGIGVAILAGFIVAPITASGGHPLVQGISSGIGSIGTCLTTFIIAVLYESQRARFDPTLYPYPPGPAYPVGPYPYAPGPYPYAPGPYPYAPGPYPPGPYPYTPGPYPAGSYPQGPYPAGPANPRGAGTPYGGAVPGYPGNPTAIPGWVNPNSAPAWPAYPNVPQSSAPVPASGQAWVSVESESPAPETKPEDPPA